VAHRGRAQSTAKSARGKVMSPRRLGWLGRPGRTGSTSSHPAQPRNGGSKEEGRKWSCMRQPGITVWYIEGEDGVEVVEYKVWIVDFLRQPG
jgi:hypothetical protein